MVMMSVESCESNALPFCIY